MQQTNRFGPCNNTENKSATTNDRWTVHGRPPAIFAAVLKTLTASYSSDTVHALAMASLFLHFLACDYSYANGFSDKKGPIDATKRPTFQGGTLSLTAAFFATILLASRLESNAAVYMFVCSSVVLFALYPAARHQVAINTQTKNRIGTCWLYFHGCQDGLHFFLHFASDSSTADNRDAYSSHFSLTRASRNDPSGGCSSYFLCICPALDMHVAKLKSDAPWTLGYCTCLTDTWSFESSIS